MKKILERFTFNFMLLLSLLLFFCCQKNDDVPTFDVTGEWIDAQSDDSHIKINTLEFTADGVYRESETYVSKETNYNSVVEGVYTNNGKIDVVYTVKYVNQYYPAHLHGVLRVIKMDKYLLHLYNETNNSELVYSRVVDTYIMEVGERKIIGINNDDFQPLEYRSVDDRVASVDDFGEIHAVKRGVTYIRVLSSGGEIAIRVEVKDANNDIIDDYIKFIGEPIANVVRDMGDYFIKKPSLKGTTSVEFNIINDPIKKLFFYYFVEDRVCQIVGELNDGADIDRIISQFNSKYNIINSNNEHLHRYNSYQNDHRSIIEIDDERRIIVYELIPNQFEFCDGIIMKTIDEVAVWLEFKIPDNSGYVGYRFVNNDIYESFIFSYDEDRDIKSLNLKCSENIRRSDVEAWFDRHYVTHIINGVKKYARGNNYLLSDYYVEIEEESGRIYVKYLSHKTTSK